MTKRIARYLAATLGSLVLMATFSPAEAGVIFYTNELTWLGAVGPLSGTEDFNSFLADAQFRTVSVAANNMTISSGTGPNGTVTNKIDARPFEFAGFFAADGTPYLLGDLVSGSNPDLHFGFTVGVTAWGADFQGIADTDLRHTRLDVFNAGNGLLGSLTLSSTDQSEQQFYGFLLTGGDVADHITFTNPDISNDTFMIDNIGFVNVPEPASLTLLGLGLGGLRLLRRDRRPRTR